MKIAIYYDDRGINNMDLRNPELGNPGIGGTEFCYLLLGKFLPLYDNSFCVSIIHYINNNLLPDSTISILIESQEDCFLYCEQNKIDYLVFCTEQGKHWYNLLEKYKQKGILWAHCFLSDEELK